MKGQVLTDIIGTMSPQSGACHRSPSRPTKQGRPDAHPNNSNDVEERADGLLKAVRGSRTLRQSAVSNRSTASLFCSEGGVLAGRRADETNGAFERSVADYSLPLQLVWASLERAEWWTSNAARFSDATHTELQSARFPCYRCDYGVADRCDAVSSLSSATGDDRSHSRSGPATDRQSTRSLRVWPFRNVGVVAVRRGDRRRQSARSGSLLAPVSAAQH